MKTSNATGHEQNVTNLNVLISRVSTLGGAYNPSVPALTIPALSSLYEQGVNINNAVNAAEVQMQNVTSARTVQFNNFDPLTTRVISALRICGVSSATLDQADAIVRDLRAKRATDKLTDEELAAEKVKGNEIRQVTLHNASYNRKIENFGKFVLFLSNVPQYSPNESDLSIEGLNTALNDYKAINNDWVAADTALTVARHARNELLYNDVTGLVDIVMAVKLYVKSVFGANSTQYKLISDISFSKKK